jgi:hypothetical protein
VSSLLEKYIYLIKLMDDAVAAFSMVRSESKLEQGRNNEHHSNEPRLAKTGRVRYSDAATRYVPNSHEKRNLQR